MHDDDLGLGTTAGARCWCGEPAARGTLEPLGVRFCTVCRARVLRSCVAELARAARRVERDRRRAG